MKKLLLALLLVHVTAFAALAQHRHGNKGPNGGVMEDVAGVHAELMTSGNAITFHITDEDGKPVATRNFTASALVVDGSRRETLSLSPGSDNTLVGAAQVTIAVDAQITLQLKTERKSGQARFKMKN